MSKKTAKVYLRGEMHVNSKKILDFLFVANFITFTSSAGWAAHVSTGATTGAAALGDANISTGMSAPNNPNNGYQSSALKDAQSARQAESGAGNAAGVAAPSTFTAPLAPADAPENAPQVQSPPQKNQK